MTTIRVADRPALGVYTKIVAGCTFLLLLAGGMVTSTGSGLAVPDWPLSFGKVMPAMEGGVLYEHGHRMVATFVGALIVVEALWLWRAEERRWVRTLGWIALGGVVLQGILGGLTVLLGLPDPVSVSHAGLAEVVFGITVTIAALRSRAWLAGGPAESVDADVPSLFSLAVACAAVLYLQILLGAVVRHTGAGLAIPTFPLAYGGLVPPLESFPVAIHFAHRVGAVVVALIAAWVVARTMRRHKGRSRLVRPAALLGALIVVQIALGGWVIWSYKAAWVTTAHLGTGALLFATALTLALRARRHLALAPAPAHAPIQPHLEVAEAR
ncbi:MAG TPA: COX15/CtaA family protein [Gemmatimonadota bacterium]|nr:COX15/CtaA family protein [Gemmatimonadota bacterium]